MFIAVDGIDGAGKTTLAQQLCELFGPLNPECTKEPTGHSKWGQLLRDAALHGRLPRDKEIEYFHLDRVHHIDHVIAPALQAGRPVITDRYVDSTLAFQARNPADADAMYEHFRHEILIPDVTFILRCTVELGLDRIEKRNGTKSQFETKEALARARDIYESRTGPNYELLDGSRTPEHTFEQAINVLRHRFVSHRRLIDRRAPDIMRQSVQQHHVSNIQ